MDTSFALHKIVPRVDCLHMQMLWILYLLVTGCGVLFEGWNSQPEMILSKMF